MAKKATIICSSYTFEKVYAVLNLANGAASMGMEVTIFFTFHGLNAIKKDGLKKIPLSKNNIFGIGKYFLKKKMEKNKIPSLEEQLSDAIELGVKLIACETSMDAMGITKNDLIDTIEEIAGIGTYINEAKDSSINLFI